MTRAPTIRRPPSLRWYIALARLRIAQLLLLPARELVHRGAALVAAGILLAVSVQYLLLELQPAPIAPAGEVQVVKAWVNFLIQLAIMLVAALVSYAMRPKPQPPEPIKAQVPIVEEGKAVRRFYGEVWITDSIVLGFKEMGTIPIKAKGGKK